MQRMLMNSFKALKIMKLKDSYLVGGNLKTRFVAGIFKISFISALFLCVSLFPTHGRADEKIVSKVVIEGHEAEIIYINTAQGRFKFTAEIADTPKKTQTGLMHRESMPFNHGMLFDFHEEKEVLMWMKNTPLSLDMVFLSPLGRVVSIQSSTTPFSQKIISSKVLASGVFEINAGTGKLLGLKVGDMFEHHSFEQGNDEILIEKAN